MKVGLTIFPTDTTIQPTRLAREAEDRGFESLWFPEHSHIPVDQRTPWGGRAHGGPVPEVYARTYDQLLALAAAAAVTERIQLGTSICLVPQRDPIWLAKEVATLDRLSGGRMNFGIGYGWNKEELAHHGVEYGERRDVLRESVLAMQRIWTEDEAAFSGTHTQFSATSLLAQTAPAAASTDHSRRGSRTSHGRAHRRVLLRLDAVGNPGHHRPPRPGTAQHRRGL